MYPLSYSVVLYLVFLQLRVCEAFQQELHFWYLAKVTSSLPHLALTFIQAIWGECEAVQRLEKSSTSLFLSRFPSWSSLYLLCHLLLFLAPINSSWSLPMEQTAPCVKSVQASGTSREGQTRLQRVSLIGMAADSEEPTAKEKEESCAMLAHALFL